MDELCKRCWNEGCKKATEEFRENKLPVCKDMEEHPDEWDKMEVQYFQEEWQKGVRVWKTNC